MELEDINALESEWKPPTGGVHPLHYAASTGDKKKVAAILKQAGSKGSPTFEAKLNEQDNFGRTCLVYAVVSGKLNLAKYLLDNGVDVNIVDNEGRGALQWAVYHDRVKLVGLLINSNADAALLDYEGRSFAHLASNGKTPKVMHLLAKMVDFEQFVNLEDNRGMTPLHWSCFHGSVSHTKELLAAGADVVAVDGEGKGPLHWAATTKSDALVGVLIAAFNSDKERAREAREDTGKQLTNIPDLQGRTALHVAVGIGNVKMVEALLALKETDVMVQDIHGRSPLIWSVQLGSVEMMQCLLDLGGEEQLSIMDANGWSALSYACHDVEANACGMLLAKHPKVEDRPDNHGQTGLMLSILSRNFPLAKTLLEQGSDAGNSDETGSTPLHVAAFVGDVSTLKKLLAGNTSGLDKEDVSGQTPLFFACEQGHTDSVKYLISKGADPKHVEGEGRTTLHFAALGSHSTLCEYMMQACMVDGNAVDVGGRSALHTATYAGDVATTEVLIANNADVNAQDAEGISPVHWAAASNSIECVAALIAAEAFLNHTEFHSERLTPLDYATMTESDNAEMIEFLQVNGALSVQEIKDLAAKHIQAWWAGYRTRIRLMSTWHQYLSSHASGDAKAALLARRKPKQNLQNREENRQIMAGKVRRKRGSQWNNQEDYDETGGLVATRLDMLGEQKPVHGSKLKALEPGTAGSPSGKLPASKKGRKKAQKPPHRVSPIEQSHDLDGISSVQSQRISKVKTERSRVEQVRRKIKAAITIQRWLRAVWNEPGFSLERKKEKFERMKRKGKGKGKGRGKGKGKGKGMDLSFEALTLDTDSRSPMAKKIVSSNPYHVRKEEQRKLAKQNAEAGTTARIAFTTIDPASDEQQVAALTIQLFWRQHLRRKESEREQVKSKGLDTSTRKPYGNTKRVEITIPAAAIYRKTGNVKRAALYRPVLERIQRPNKALNVPLVAISAFNLAYSTYWPAEVAERIMRKTQQLTHVSDEADAVLQSFVNNMGNISRLRMFQQPPTTTRTGAQAESWHHNPQFTETHPHPDTNSYAIALSQGEPAEAFA